MPPGRRPTPTATKLLNGNPGHRAINRNEPKFSGIPTCPKHLNKGAKTEWRRISAELAASGLLTNVDRAALAAYCTAYSRWVEAEAKVVEWGLVIPVGQTKATEKNGQIIPGKPGYPIQNPYVGVANTALEQMRRWAVEFGMTPSARSRIHVDHSGGNGNSGDAFADFMKGIGAMDEPEDTHEDLEPEQLRTESE